MVKFPAGGEYKGQSVKNVMKASMGLIGPLNTFRIIKTEGDREAYRQVVHEFNSMPVEKQEEILRDAGIVF